MYRCNKQIEADSIYNDFSNDDIEFTLASCEQNCDKYYQCSYVALMQDLLKKRGVDE